MGTQLVDVLASTAAPTRPPTAVIPSAPALDVAPPRRLRGWVLVSAAALLVAAMAVTAATVYTDSGEDLGRLLGSVGRDIGRLRWQFALIVILLGATHYLATAVAARAASGRPLPFGETVLVQLAAAAANRVTPAGLGGSTLTARYFTRRGLDAAGAVGAVSALAVLGAVADLLVLCALVAGSRMFGLGGGAQQLRAFTVHIRNLLGPVRSPWLWLAVAVALAAAGGWWLARTRRRTVARGQFWGPVRKLLTRPRSLATLLAASGTTTLVLGIAFVASIAMVPGPRPTASVGVILVAFMLGSAAGSSVPVPAGLGSTEAALVAVLVGLGEPAAQAVQVVLIFRLITFWAPAAIGVLAMRSLYRRDAF